MSARAKATPYEVVERPDSHGNAKKLSPEIKAIVAELIKTATTGKALRLSRAQTDIGPWNLRYFRVLGYRLRTKADGPLHTIAWCEPLNGALVRVARRDGGLLARPRGA